MVKESHQHYKARKQGNWFRTLLLRAGLMTPPEGTTIGPVWFKQNPDRPNRHERRGGAAIWRRYGEHAVKIMKRYGCSRDEALRRAMEA